MNKFNKNEGFTLVEIIVVIAIIGIAFVPMLNYFTNSISHIHEIETRSQAITIAGDIIELIKQESSSKWSYLDNFNNNDNSNDPDSEEEKILNNIKTNYDFLADFLIDIQLSNFDSSEDIQELDILISWNSGTKSEELVTIIQNKIGDE